ncbi:MAG: hypothetical protein JOZ51_13585 [Chloroflexi bacterium]|nr:hypothetical protein [Chloroflexota bacterium]
MEAREYELQPQAQQSRQSTIGTGLVLVGIGLMIFLVNRLDLGVMLFPLLGGSFLLWGVLSRAAGPLVPGGVLSGIGLGVVLKSQFGQLMSDEHAGGLFLLGFAVGWLIITLLSRIATDDPQWWALIPGGIMATVGGAVLLGGVWLDLLSWISAAWLSGLSLVGGVWPLGLIALGIFLLWRQRQPREVAERTE